MELDFLRLPFNATLNNLTVNLANAGSSAVISTAINGGSLGDSLENAIIDALVQTAHGAAASKIKGLDNHYIAHKVAHAMAGCAAAAANRGKCQDGAIGAVVGEIVGEVLVNSRNPATWTTKEREQLLAYSKLVAGTVSSVANGDVDAAANAAAVAVENNALKWTSTTQEEVRKEAEKRKKQDDWLSIVLPAHAAALSKEQQAKDLSSFRAGLRTISLSGAVVSGYSPIVLLGGKTYFIAIGSSIVSGATTSVLIEKQPYKVSDLVYDASLGVLINKKTSQMIKWANSDSPIIKNYLRGKGEATNYLLGKGASEAINQSLKDKNAVLIEVPEWRKQK